MEKEHRRARKAQARKLKAESRLAAKVARSTSSGAEGDGGGAPSGNGNGGGGRGSTSGSSTLGRRMTDLASGLSRRSRRPKTDEGEDEVVELSDLRERRLEREARLKQQRADRPATAGRDATLPLPATASQSGSALDNHVHGADGGAVALGSALSDSSPTSSSSSPTLPPAPANVASLLGYPFAVSAYLLSRLARAHDEATKARAHRVDPRRRRGGGAGGEREERRGWGLGEFGVEEVRGGEDRLRDARRELRQGRLLGGGQGDADDDDAPDGDWVDEEVIRSAPLSKREQRRRAKQAKRERKAATGEGESGWSWWGPLREFLLSCSPGPAESTLS